MLDFSELEKITYDMGMITKKFNSLLVRNSSIKDEELRIIENSNSLIGRIIELFHGHTNIR